MRDQRIDRLHVALPPWPTAVPGIRVWADPDVVPRPCLAL